MSDRIPPSKKPSRDHATDRAMHAADIASRARAATPITNGNGRDILRHHDGGTTF